MLRIENLVMDIVISAVKTEIQQQIPCLQPQLLN